MSKFLFVLTRGPEDPTRAVRCFQFAKIAADKGHEVAVFLVDDAVYFTNLSLTERIKAPTGDELITYWKFLVEKQATILVCKPAPRPASSTPTSYRQERPSAPASPSSTWRRSPRCSLFKGLIIFPSRLTEKTVSPGGQAE